MPARMRIPVIAIVAVLSLLVMMATGACGADSSTDGRFEVTQVREERESAAATSAPAATRAPSSAGSDSSRQSEATSAPAAVQMYEEEEASDGGTTGFFQNSPLTDEALSSLVTQNRVIVRTVDMGIIVPNVPRAKGDIAILAEGLGGWEVDSERTQRHEASISVRVPAELLGQFLQRLKDMAVEVDYENSTSQDVTTDFVDNEARLTVLRSTEARLLEFHSRAVNVEETVNLEAELSRVQLEIEVIQGRLRFMAETSVYSLVNVVLTTEPGQMPVEIGTDATFRAGVRAGFQATFRPPEGVDEFRFIWDFGDGSGLEEGTRTAPTTNSGERVTATVSHTFTNVEESPYIVQLDIRGIGDAGLFLGTDTLIATVTQIPGIEVFAGEDRVVDEGDEMEYTGSFTRPESLWDFRYRWDFGDGSATVFEVPEQDETRAVAEHAFPDHRPDPYRVVLTVIAQSDAGEIRGSSTFHVRVNEVEGFIVAGWEVGNTFKSAVRALSVVGQVVLTVLIWVGIFSPVWLAVIAAFIVIPRIRRRFGWGMGRTRLVARQEASWQQGQAEPGTAAAAPGSVQSAAPGLASESGRAGGEPQNQLDTPDTPDALEDGSALLCPSCGVVYPAIDNNGLPARFCPYCGAESPSLEHDDQTPNT